MALCIKCKVEGKRKKATKGRYCQYHYEEAKAKKRIDFIPLRDYWYSIMGRCYKEHWKLYQAYGVRGFTVCEEWQDRSNFITWARQNGYRKGKLIKFNSSECKVYGPENCYIE